MLVIGKQMNGSLCYLMVNEEKYMLFENETEVKEFLEKTGLIEEGYVSENAEEVIKDQEKYNKSLRHYRNQEKQQIVIGRPINGISLNGLEYLMDENGEYMKFESVEEAKGFLRENGFAELTDDELEDSFMFENADEVIKED